MRHMYSEEWFETFAATVPAAIIETELEAIVGVLPPSRYRRLLDIGCGIGRIAGPLSSRGYAVTGLDISVEALRTAQRGASGPRYVALDQGHIGRMRWRFDGALLLWNSIGFVGRSADLETLTSLAKVIEPGGQVVFDLYHPDWLHRNERPGDRDDRGAVVRRWMDHSRCFNEIRYPSGQVDDIQFDVYRPAEISDLCARAGLEPRIEMAWWNPETRPSPDYPRYQLVCARP